MPCRVSFQVMVARPGREPLENLFDNDGRRREFVALAAEGRRDVSPHAFKVDVGFFMCPNGSFGDK